MTPAKNQKDGSIVESDRSYLGYASNERKNMEKRKEGRKTRWQKMTAFIFLRQPNWRVLLEEKRKLLADNRRRMMVCSDRQWTMQLPSPSSDLVQRAFLSNGKKGMKKCKEKKISKKVLSNGGWERIACVSSFRDPLFPFPSSASQ